jgi:hypothetical protein
MQFFIEHLVLTRQQVPAGRDVAQQIH